MPETHSTNRYLWLLIFSQFAGTSLWFAGNAIVDQLSSAADTARITTSVQIGFIAGTLLFSLFTVADRYPAKAVFFYSSLLAALANSCILLFYHLPFALLGLRFLTGFFLAGIYPVGMKIAADVFPQKLGKALGLLVGALVLGTAFPHFVRSQLGGLNWQYVIIVSSLLAGVGGAVVLLFMPSPKKPALPAKPDFAAAFTVFRNKAFRSAAFGYFGHMWELYALWSVLPLLLSSYQQSHHVAADPYWWSFLSIGVGCLGCAFGGFLSLGWGSEKVAFWALLFSFTCCLLAPILFKSGPAVFYPFLLVWGVMVVADSPQFSALVAKAAGQKVKGTALTAVTCIGFAITIVSIQLLKDSFSGQKEAALWLLAPGPLLGLIALKWKK
jgi:MFS family permease